MSKIENKWYGYSRISPQEYICGHCDKLVASNIGYYNNYSADYKVYICPNCAHITYFAEGKQLPGALEGVVIENLPETVSKVYREVRSSIVNGNYIAAILLSRKLLMHLAVDNGAPANLKFVQYVDFLNSKGFVPPKSKAWVDKIRLLGNMQNHQVDNVEESDASSMAKFIELLLVFMYKYTDETLAP